MYFVPWCASTSYNDLRIQCIKNNAVQACNELRIKFPKWNGSLPEICSGVGELSRAQLLSGAGFLLHVSSWHIYASALCSSQLRAFCFWKPMELKIYTDRWNLTYFLVTMVMLVSESKCQLCSLVCLFVCFIKNTCPLSVEELQKWEGFHSWRPEKRFVTEKVADWFNSISLEPFLGLTLLHCVCQIRSMETFISRQVLFFWVL